MEDHLRKFVGLVLEARTRGDVRVSNSQVVPFGSLAHVKDLESRIDQLVLWRNASTRGSEKRANYARLISQLRNELRSARRFAEKHGEPAIS